MRNSRFLIFLLLLFAPLAWAGEGMDPDKVFQYSSLAYDGLSSLYAFQHTVASNADARFELHLAADDRSLSQLSSGV